MVPVLALFLRIPLGELVDQLDNQVVIDALVVTAKTNAIAFGLTLLVGTPAAYFIGRRRFPGRNLVITAIELPLVLPPAVAGIGLLAAFGRFGLLGETFTALGHHDRLHPDGGRPGDPLRRRALLPAPGDRDRSRPSTTTSSSPRARSARARGGRSGASPCR